MTMNWKQMETANGAGADVPAAATQVLSVPERLIVRPLRWKQDAVCRDAAADADLREAEPGDVSGVPADSTGSSLTRTYFFSSRIQTQPSTRKEPLNTTQEKKGKNKQQQVIIRKKLETLA